MPNHISTQQQKTDYERAGLGYEVSHELRSRDQNEAGKETESERVESNQLSPAVIYDPFAH